MEPKAAVVYVRLRRRLSAAPGTIVTLGQAARLVAEPEVDRKLRELPLYRLREEDGNRVVIDMLQVVHAIRTALPGTAVETYGEPHVLVEIRAAGDAKPRLALLVLAWLLLFFGSGMAIMNFHADVDMAEVQQRIAQLLTGSRDFHPWLFQVPYSLGLGLGMLLFFNRLLRKRLNDEPNPLEVEMFMYQENVNHYVITEEYRKKHDEGAGGRG